MKKLILCVIVVLCAAALASCASVDSFLGTSDTTNDRSDSETRAELQSAISADTTPKYNIPFTEGFYSDGTYGMELKYTGDGSKHSYNVGFFSCESGTQKFFGTFSPSKDDACAFVAYSYGDNSLRVIGCKLKDEAENGGFEVTFYNGDSIVSSISGKYTYTGKSWQYDETTAHAVICEGEYINGDYSLSVTSDGSAVYFSVTDKNGNELFSGSKDVSSGAVMESAVFDADKGTGCSIIFAAGVSRGKPYIDVAEYGGSCDIKFDGIFTSAQ